MKRSGFRPKPRPPRPEPVAYTLRVRPNGKANRRGTVANYNSPGKCRVRLTRSS